MTPERIEGRRAAVRKYDTANRELRRTQAKARRDADPQKHREAVRRYRLANPERVAEARATIERNRKAEDPLYKMQRTIRRRLCALLQRRGITKKTTTMKILGCDWDTLRSHLEGQFTPGMSWENRELWHVDHKRPLSAAVDEADLLARSHYTNLQPLWALDNMIKGATQ